MNKTARRELIATLEMKLASEKVAVFGFGGNKDNKKEIEEEMQRGHELLQELNAAGPEYKEAISAVWQILHLLGSKALKSASTKTANPNKNVMMGGPASGLLLQIAAAVSKLKKLAKDQEMSDGLTQVYALVEKAFNASKTA